MVMEGLIGERQGSFRTVLTLGDGDFTFSLDLARWLLENRSDDPVHLIATGIDTRTELTAKYKDAPSILKRLQRFGTPSITPEDDWGPLKVTVLHGVNAVDDTEHDVHQFRVDVVIFNHPHLGVEDAQLHQLFLCHLFHAVECRWLNREGGVFHLTLVHGQFERWSCEAAARRNGLALVAETPFATPTVDDPSYELRRHQSGKSFKSRRSEGRSGIYTFVRADCCPADRTSVRRPHGICPFWISGKRSESASPQMFPCSLCSKTFREERSLRNHMVSAHADPNRVCDDKRKREGDDATRILSCRLCAELGVERSFVCSQSLEDHVQAKHSALHKTIPADWSGRKAWSSDIPEPPNELASKSEEQRSHGSCDVCGFVFRSMDGRRQHQLLFLPVQLERHAADESAPLGEVAATPHTCSFCCKAFRERRARLQHENRCSLAHSPSLNASVIVVDNPCSIPRDSQISK